MGTILLQAVLGGVTVLLHLPTQVSVAHAGLAQFFFCLIVTLSLVTSRSWIAEQPHRLTDRPSSIRKWAAWTTALVYLQIVVEQSPGTAGPAWPFRTGLFPSARLSPRLVPPGRLAV